MRVSSREIYILATGDYFLHLVYWVNTKVILSRQDGDRKGALWCRLTSVFPPLKMGTTQVKLWDENPGVCEVPHGVHWCSLKSNEGLLIVDASHVLVSKE